MQTARVICISYQRKRKRNRTKAAFLLPGCLLPSCFLWRWWLVGPGRWTRGWAPGLPQSPHDVAQWLGNGPWPCATSMWNVRVAEGAPADYIKWGRPSAVTANCSRNFLAVYNHAKFGFKKHRNGINPPICFLFKCASYRCAPLTPGRPCCRFQGKSPEIIAFPGSEPF
jgi:hypothetical protein